MKILVVEDEPSLLAMMRKGFAEHQVSVSVAMDGNTALQMLRQHNFDAVILDIMLPEVNGLEVCRRIRAGGDVVPVMLLTGLGSSENIVTGLDTGADDYLVKPFKFSELEARVRALIRRSNYTDQKHHIITVADLTIDRVSKSVQRGGQLVRLTALEFKLLDFLARNAGIVVSRNQILESVWDIHFDMNTNVVDVYITYLRKKIDRPHPRKLIHTIKGLGYVLRDDEG